jgi:hypothetical protein
MEMEYGEDFFVVENEVREVMDVKKVIEIQEFNEFFLKNEWFWEDFIFKNPVFSILQDWLSEPLLHLCRLHAR